MTEPKPKRKRGENIGRHGKEPVPVILTKDGVDYPFATQVEAAKFAGVKACRISQNLKVGAATIGGFGLRKA